MFPQQLPLKKRERRKGRSTEHTSTASFCSFLPVDSVLWCGGSGGLFYLELAGERRILKPTLTQTVWPQRVAQQTATDACLLNVTHSDSWNRVCKLIDSEAALKVAERPATKTGSPVPVTFEIQFRYSDFLIFSPHYSLLSLTWCNNFTTAAHALGNSVLTVYLFYCLHLFCFKIYWAAYQDSILSAYTNAAY